MRLRWFIDLFLGTERLRQKILGRKAVQVKAPESNNGTAWISRFLGVLWVDNSEVERTKSLHADLSNEWVQIQQFGQSK